MTTPCGYVCGNKTSEGYCKTTGCINPKINGSIAFTLNSPITEEQWDIITDVDLDNTPRVIFQTKHGKEVEYVKVVRCKDCKHFRQYSTTERKYSKCDGLCRRHLGLPSDDNGFCSDGERKTDDTH